MRINRYYICIFALGLLISNAKASIGEAEKASTVLEILSTNNRDKVVPSAEKIMEQASSLFTDKEGVSIRFEMITKNNQSAVIDSNRGILKMDHLKYMLKTDVSQSWYDGSTQWSYLVDTEEVNILKPSSEELLESNPYLFLFSYRDLFEIKLLSEDEKTSNQMISRALYSVELVPKDDDYPYQKIILGIDTISYQISLMKIFMTDGNAMDLTVQEFRTGIKYPTDTFQFVTRLLPDAEVIDLR